MNYGTCVIYIECTRHPRRPPSALYLARQEDISKYLDATDPVAGAAASEAAAAAIKVRGSVFFFYVFTYFVVEFCRARERASFSRWACG